MMPGPAKTDAINTEAEDAPPLKKLRIAIPSAHPTPEIIGRLPTKPTATAHTGLRPLLMVDARTPDGMLAENMRAYYEGGGREERTGPHLSSPVSKLCGIHKAVEGSHEIVRRHLSEIVLVYDVDPRILGRGQSGVVRCGKHRQLGHQVAIKSVLKHRIKNILAVRNEIQILQGIEHPNIIKYHETFEDRRYIHIVMELCTGGELFDRIISATENNAMTECRVRRIIRSILSATAFCHKHRIVHRDLKPENFLLTGPDLDTADIKVIDFGLSATEHRDHDMTARVGTAYYIAPEVMSGHYTKACDLWSIGVVLYILLAGSPPFAGTSDKEVLRKVVIGKYSFLGDKWAAISDGAKGLVSCLLDMDPARRATAEQALAHPWLQPRPQPLPMMAMRVSPSPPAPLAATAAATAARGSTCPPPSLPPPRSAFPSPSASPPNKVITRAVLASMCAFCNHHRFKRIVLNVLAKHIAVDQMPALKSSFERADVSKMGRLTVVEIDKALRSSGHDVCAADIKCLLKSMDMQHKGAVNYSEFLAASLEKKFYLQEERIFWAFNRLDNDPRDGYISVLELRAVLEKYHWDPETALELLEAVDLNHDGRIDYYEFLEMMRQQPRLALVLDKCGSNSSRLTATVSNVNSNSNSCQ